MEKMGWSRRNGLGISDGRDPTKMAFGGSKYGIGMSQFLFVFGFVRFLCLIGFGDRSENWDVWSNQSQFLSQTTPSRTITVSSRQSSIQKSNFFIPTVSESLKIVESKEILIFDAPESLQDWVKHILQLLSKIKIMDYSFEKAQSLRLLFATLKIISYNNELKDLATKAYKHLKDLISDKKSGVCFSKLIKLMKETCCI